VCIFVAGLLSACATCPPVDSHFERISRISDYMVPLGKAVDVVVDDLALDAKDDKVFAAVVSRSGDPQQLKPFDGYMLKARIVELTGYRAGVVLLCTGDGKEGVIEDVTCTTRPDTFRPTASPCEYLLDVRKVCEGTIAY